MSPFSILILTLNEERNLPECLESVRWCDDVHVLDSFSTDGTLAIAQAAGAEVRQRAFTDFADQRNYGGAALGFRHDWVFHMDADERFTPELKEECMQRAEENSVDGWFAAPKMIFSGRWIPRCTDFPAYQARFVHRERFRFIQAGHGQREAPEMRMGHLRANYLHNLSAGTFSDWLNKHRRYARAEAEEALGLGNGQAIGQFLSANPLVRRRALKRLSYRVPFRPVARFCYQYLWRGGLLDGYPGLRYCRLLAYYEWLVAREMRRLRRERRSPSACVSSS